MNDSRRRSFLGDIPVPQTPPSSHEKGSKLRGKVIDGVRYVRVEDVIKLLDLNRALPGVAASLKRQLRKPS